MNVVSFNLRCMNDGDGDNNWPFRKEAALEVIRKYDPDILGTQEGTPHQVEFLDEQLDSYMRIGRGRDVDGGEHGAIFLKKSCFDLVDSGDFWLSDTPDVPGSKHWGNNCVRMVTYGVVKLRDNGQLFLAVNTHLDHESELARQKGAVLIQAFIDELGLPTILTGDMNALPTSVAIQFFTGKTEIAGKTGSLIDSREAVGLSAENGTFHGYGTVEQGIIDYVLISKHFTVKEYAILKDKPSGRFPSDHYPVMATVNLDPTS